MLLERIGETHCHAGQTVQPQPVRSGGCNPSMAATARRRCCRTRAPGGPPRRFPLIRVDREEAEKSRQHIAMGPNADAPLETTERD